MSTSESSLSNGGKAIVAIVAVAGVVASLVAGQASRDAANARWRAEAAAEADRLTATFGLLLESARAPLVSLATLFNGSGRVAAEEFTGTIEALRKQAGPFFPEAMAFVTRSNPASCDQAEGCWLVAYSTADQGLLNPGADLSRFGPTAATIAGVLADQGVMMIGPPFREADGTQRSFLAVTMKNTRQFGVLASLVDYVALVRELERKWLPAGVSLRIDAAFPDGSGLTEPQTVYGGVSAPAGTAVTLDRQLESTRAKFALHWDFSASYLGGSGSAAAGAITAAGILASLLAALFAARLLRGGR
ncbi:MAG: hypothetical protein SFV21_19565 [Rhodospirillaceae bacterium]|nr:hypothetical protein [Rhodospirillaceae bacterium]